MRVKTILSAVAIAAAAVSFGAGAANAESQSGSVYNNVKYNFGSNTWKMDSKYLPAEISYKTDEKPGTVIISTRKKYLYVVQEGGTAKRFGIGVGRRGFRWSGEEKVSRKAEWPAWHPPSRHASRVPGSARIASKASRRAIRFAVPRSNAGGSRRSAIGR